jgi:tripartite ATP-independent transporter DctP family solute receptor
MRHWCILISSLLLFSACADKKKEVEVLRLAHGLDVSHTVHRSMEYMAQQLDSLSDGKLKIQIYPSQQLGTERECLELLQIGSLDITKVSAAVLENFAPKLKVLSLPYIFTSKEHQFRVLDGPVGKELLAASRPFKLEGLCFYDAGSRSFYTIDKPLQTPEDLSGLKIRVQESATAIGMVKALGGSPTPISWGELYTALQQGVVDGAENNPPSFYLSRHYEVCKYYTINQHTMVPDVVLVSSATMDRLTEQQKKWLRQAAQSSVTYQRKLWQEDVEQAMAEVQKAGVEVIFPEKEPFMERTETLISTYAEDTELRETIQKIRNDRGNQ